MKEAVIDNAENMQKILDACEQGGHSSVVCVSNTGLIKPLVRVTIVPNSAFRPDARKVTNAEWMAAYKDIWQEQQAAAKKE